MQTRSRIFDDLAQLLTNAAGVAQGMKEETETLVRSWLEHWIAEAELVTREEFEAVREMAARAREENERLAERIEALETRVAQLEKAAAGHARGGKSGKGG